MIEDNDFYIGMPILVYGKLKGIVIKNYHPAIYVKYLNGKTSRVSAFHCEKGAMTEKHKKLSERTKNEN